MREVLFVANHRIGRSPAQRFRFEQYLDFLDANGFHCQVSHLLSEEDDLALYRPNGTMAKARIGLKSILIRLRDLLTSSRYDIIFVQREALMLGTTFFERQFKETRARLIYDFDDAIWISDVSEANKKLAWLKNPAKTAAIIELADLVIAGNEFLASYARRFNNSVRIIPTTIDTGQYVRPSKPRREGPVRIGWSGSLTTIRYFEHAIPFLRKIKQQHGDRVSFKVVGDGSYRNPELDIVGIAWQKEREVEDLCSFDIGIMPLPDEEWAKGKCGLKGLQYMALEIPTIMSPVGVNNDIIQNGRNGVLAADVEGWVSAINQLIESPELRNQMGKAARETVVRSYSVAAHQSTYLDCLQTVLRSA